MLTSLAHIEEQGCVPVRQADGGAAVIIWQGRIKILLCPQGRMSFSLPTQFETLSRSVRQNSYSH